MTHSLNRRLFGAGLAALILAAPAAKAADHSGLTGTWGGARGQVSAQVIVDGTTVIGFYWRGDYMDARDAKLSAVGNTLTFAFDGGAATLTRTGETTAGLDIRDGATLTHLDLKRD